MTNTNIEELAIQLAHMTARDFGVFRDDEEPIVELRKLLLDHCLPLAVEMVERRKELEKPIISEECTGVSDE